MLLLNSASTSAQICTIDSALRDIHPHEREFAAIRNNAILIGGNNKSDIGLREIRTEPLCFDFVFNFRSLGLTKFPTKPYLNRTLPGEARDGRKNK